MVLIIPLLLDVCCSLPVWLPLSPAPCPQTKTQKTLDANQKALKAAEKKAQQQLKQARPPLLPLLLLLLGSASLPFPPSFPLVGCQVGAHACAPAAADGLPLPPLPACLPAHPRARPQVRSSAAAPTITRKPFWFEKFHWFISSGGCLVRGWFSRKKG